jgi:anti-sigma B factor antagonist
VPVEPDRFALSAEDGELRLVGELDAYTGPSLQEALAALGPESDVTLDLGEVTFIDSSALRILVGETATRADAGGAVRLRGPSVAVLRLLEVSGLADHFEIVPAGLDR